MTLIYFLIVIGILVFVHEFGHFIMAKRAGVRVEKFSLGMGPKLVGYKKGDTEYVISALPLGGYVKMAGENPDEEPTGASDEFQAKTVWQRAKIAAAGSLTNIVLAFVLMPLVFMLGTYMIGPAKVATVEKGSPAELAGLQRGDVIERVNGRIIHDWVKAWKLFAVNPDVDVIVDIDRNGQKKKLVLRPVRGTKFNIGLSGLITDMPAQLASVRQDSPAEKAGLRAGDKVLSVNGRTVFHYDQFSPMINQDNGGPKKISVERSGQKLTFVVVPRKEGDRYMIGVEIKAAVQLVLQKYGFVDAVVQGYQRNIENIDLTLITLRKLFTLNLSIKTLGGPIKIAQLSGEAAKGGLSNFIEHMALISLSLGILNLLPIPVLDGGLLLFLAVEAVRRKPLSRTFMERAQAIGAALLIMLIAVVSYNDVMQMFFGK